MNSYEVLLDEICSNINVVEAELFNATGLLGVYKEGKGIIIDKNMETDLKKTTLMEEYMHSKYTVGNILDQSSIENRKQELLARKYAYIELVPLDALIEAYSLGLTQYYEVADFLEVDIEFLWDATNYYKSTYGTMFQYKGVLIHFSNTITMEFK